MKIRLVVPVFISAVIFIFLGTVIAAYTSSQETSSSSQTWKQVNVSGFGDQGNGQVNALEVFGGSLYGSTSNSEEGAQIWRTSNAISWAQVVSSGFSSVYTNTNAQIFDLIEFDGQLYAGAGSWSDDGVPGQIWRSPDGEAWTQVVGDGFGNNNNIGIVNFGIYSNTLYVATFNNVDGVEIWRTNTGNNGEWTNVVSNGNGNANNVIGTGFIEFNGYFYMNTDNEIDGAEIWRTTDGLIWTVAASGGFGDVDNSGTGSSTIFDGYLYVGTSNDITGPQMYRSNNGTTWTQVMGDGFSDVNNLKIESLITFNDALFAGTRNETTGIEVWKSTDGITWNQANIDGFGYENNNGTLWSVGTVIYNNNLYIGTTNYMDSGGGEVRLYLENQVFLPSIIK